MNVSPKLFCVLLSTALSVSAVAQEASRSTQSSGTTAAPYCLALRGNGESEPAHWGALASLVEKKGLPLMQAGGSSATISLFLLESIATNPLVSKSAPEAQKNRAALFLKSLYGIASYLGTTPQSQAGLGIYSQLKTGKMAAFKALLKGLAGSGGLGAVSPGDLEELVSTLRELGIGDSPRYAFLLETLKKPYRLLSVKERGRTAFYFGELKRSLAVLGSFDAESDADLFFRDGVINFRKLGLGAGQIATLLAGEQWDAATAQEMNAFIETCEGIHNGKTWQELVASEPRCQEHLVAATKAFFAQTIDWSKANVALRPIGRGILTFPTTAVLTKSAYTTAHALYAKYHGERDRSVSKQFSIASSDDVRLGYWGRADALSIVAGNLRRPFTDASGRRFDFSQDAKSKKFLALGPATWVDVLSLSPAEPGLASLQPMKVNGEDALSAGGWSDLHPIPVLKAAGCNEVVYVTRKGGESLFGQGVAKRVLNLDRSWDYLRTSDPESTKRNAALNRTGDGADMTSLWSRLYNVANPDSSYMHAVASADAVLCTDWDRFDVKSGLEDIVTESYEAPFVVRADRTDLRESLVSAGARIVADPLSFSSDGSPDWVGCRPPKPN